MRIYVVARRNLHVASSNHQAFHSQLTPRLQQVLQGIKKDQANRQPTTHLPITLTIMRHYKAVITTQPWNHHTAMMWGACCVAFFGFLCCSKSILLGISQYDPTVHLSFSDLRSCR